MFRRGFTFIEIMILVAIIGIVTAVAFPAYQRYRQGVVPKSNMKCLNGYVYIKDEGHTIKVIKENGQGIEC